MCVRFEGGTSISISIREVSVDRIFCINLEPVAYLRCLQVKQPTKKPTFWMVENII